MGVLRTALLLPVVIVGIQLLPPPTSRSPSRRSTSGRSRGDFFISAARPSRAASDPRTRAASAAPAGSAFLAARQGEDRRRRTARQNSSVCLSLYQNHSSNCRTFTGRGPHPAGFVPSGSTLISAAEGARGAACAAASPTRTPPIMRAISDTRSRSSSLRTLLVVRCPGLPSCRRRIADPQARRSARKMRDAGPGGGVPRPRWRDRSPPRSRPGRRRPPRRT